jgi:hypothetical protein
MEENIENHLIVTFNFDVQVGFCSDKKEVRIIYSDRSNTYPFKLVLNRFNVEEGLLPYRIIRRHRNINILKTSSGIILSLNYMGNVFENPFSELLI